MLRSIFHPLTWAILLIIYVGFTLTSCPTQPNNPPDPATLSVEYTTCTEVWLRVQAPDTARQAGVQVYRDDSLVVNFPVAPPDTVVIDGGLQPNTTYAYHTVRFQDGDEQSPSEPLSVTTLPTTSHQFTWTIDTLGNPQYGSSELNDVAIVDRDNIWAVGDIETDSGRYNLAKWDGSQWRLSRIGAPGVIGEGIWYFSANDVWVATGILYHWNGHIWERYHLWDMGVLNPDDGGVTHIWGTSSSNMYFVGRGGTIVHYDGATFTRLASGTSVDFRDIWGARKGALVMISGYSTDTGKSVVLRIQHNRVEQFWGATTSSPTPPFGHTVASLWGNPYQQYFASTAGIIRVRQYALHTAARLLYPPRWVYRMRGTGPNNLAIVGDEALIEYYDGLQWHWLHGGKGRNIPFYAVDVLPRLVVAVGSDYTTFPNQAVVYRGRR